MASIAVVNPTTAQLWGIASQHFAAQRLDAAYELVLAIVQRDPTDAAAWLALAQIDLRFGRVRFAERHALSAIRQPTDNAELLCAVNDVLFTTGAVAATRGGVARVVQMDVYSPGVQTRIGLHYQNLGAHAEALSWLKRAHAGEPTNRTTSFLLAVQLTFNGFVGDAEALLETCADVEHPVGRVMAQLSQLRAQTNDRNHLQRLSAQLRNVDYGSEDSAALEFARYKELEDLGRYPEAWRALASANAVMRVLAAYDSTAERRTFDALAKCVAALPRSSSDVHDTTPTPIFIVGLPRSGTTLLDRMLANHSEVCSAGELGTFLRGLQWAADRFTSSMLDEPMVARLPGIDWPQLGARYLENAGWHAVGERFFIDKMPRNWLLAPLIHLALPHARILHLVRMPMDVAFSNYRCYFGLDYPYSYDIATIAEHYRRYREMMARWHQLMPGRILDVAYNDLVGAPEATLRRVFDFCGLAWEPGCSDISRNTRPVATLSATQVRRAVERNLARRWTPYAAQLSDLRMMLGDDGA